MAVLLLTIFPQYFKLRHLGAEISSYNIVSSIRPASIFCIAKTLKS